jgi:hypothetical protein
MIPKKTSQQWWDGVKSDNSALRHWLTQQYSGELSASDRIKQYILAHAPNYIDQKSIERVMYEEDVHADWIKDLLIVRQIPVPTESASSDRYWEAVLGNSELSYQEACGIAAHAEEMRLERIKVIADDVTAPWDIRETFINILKDETYHAKLFKHLAGDAYNDAAKGHADGIEALGLII